MNYLKFKKSLYDCHAEKQILLLNPVLKNIVTIQFYASICDLLCSTYVIYLFIFYLYFILITLFGVIEVHNFL